MSSSQSSVDYSRCQVHLGRNWKLMLQESGLSTQPTTGVSLSPGTIQLTSSGLKDSGVMVAERKLGFAFDCRN